jgi:insertion element IS1 protein InsB
VAKVNNVTSVVPGTALVTLFILYPTYHGRLLSVKQTMVDMAMNGSGVRDPSRVLPVSPKTVISALKKAVQLEAVNQAELAQLEPEPRVVCLCQWEDVEAEADEMWSYVQRKSQQRWLWHVINHQTGAILA